MKILRIAFPLASAALSAAAAAADPAGYVPLSFAAAHRDRPVAGAVWYPAAGPGRPTLFADSPVFQGVPVVEDAQVAPGVHPVVLLSHGLGGGLRSVAWLGAALAERGAVAVAVDHQHTTYGDFDMTAGMRHWTRAWDLSRALDAVEADPRFAWRLDPARVMAAGFSYGGWTALSLGGLRGDLAGYVAHCRTYGAASAICPEVLSPEVDLPSASPADWDARYADPRVTAVAAIEPGLTWGLGPDAAAGLVDRVRLIGLGAGADRMLATDFDASGLAALLPDAQVDRIAPAVHFTAMPLCKPGVAEILRAEADDPVCTDPAGADRAAAHRQIVDAIAGDLGL